jgi:hypothetical protein
MGSKLLSASWTRSYVSARAAARLGLVNRPSNISASDSEDACRKSPRRGETSRPASDQPLAREEPQPQEERQRRVGGVFLEAPRHVEAGVLEHVGRVEPALQPAVQPHAHHLLQSAAVPLEQLGQCPAVPAEGALQKNLVIAVIAWHG